MNDVTSTQTNDSTRQTLGTQFPKSLHIEYLPITAISPNPRNPRNHSKRQVQQLAKSIETFGFNVPLLVDQSEMLIAGHGRLQACQLLGWREVPVIRLEHLTTEQAQAYLIADNRLTEISSWNDELLAQELKLLSDLDLSFSLDVIGFDMGEIDVRIQSLDVVDENDADPADEIHMVSGTPVSQLGDLWLLDKHRVLCADSLLANTYEILMNNQRATVVFEDAPFNVKVNGHVGGKGSIKHREFEMASGEMTSTEFQQFLRTVLGYAAQFSKDGSIHFQCMDWRHIDEMMAAGRAVYTELKNLCVWSKHAGGMGSLYRSQHELVFVFKNGTAPHINNVELGRHGRYRTNVWSYPGIGAMRHDSDEGDLLKLHPTVKPIRMVADAILDVSNRGDIVLDGFLGSGTTLMAAQRTGRICYAIELDPLYVDTAIRRWQKDAGIDAIHAQTGQTFTQRQQRIEQVATQQQEGQS
ncbi:ParB N-terminal domain-containing protein [Polynucleobacter sp. JS-Safj-400b-B2]|jgi:hypothetical protein|uniref:site-specific DNA-methyltransferase n=1 Tax=Polynucleobacter sp. JS-Safj-400b-B2 TaxID=2576921 RepID=UPI001C0C5151|nr:DNA methyltransferase [Polynucleobacter sp. JS-Safj-400b-B2]MBU3626599.1 ParB N-terminal domain-containing protein [Polynucleobacter sp. JS-Safj-400b-B2]